jgi:DNA repair exonuclease SbcCD ATPase subunit
MFNNQPVQSRFTLGVRGYDPTEVDAHVRALEDQSAALEAALAEAGKAAESRTGELAAARREVTELERLLADLFEEPGKEPRPPVEGIGRCIEAILRTSREQVEQLRHEARSVADVELQRARAEAERLAEEAAGQRADAARLRDEAETDRAQARVERDEAQRELDQARERAREAAQELQAAMHQRDGVVEHLRALTSNLDQWLNVRSDGPVTTPPGETVESAPVPPASST